MQTMYKLLEPLVKAHEEASALGEDDVHLFYHVKLSRKSEYGDTLLDMQSTIPMHGLLSKSGAKGATDVVEQMVQMHILTPIIGSIQNVVSDMALDDEDDDGLEHITHEPAMLTDNALQQAAEEEDSVDE